MSSKLEEKCKVISEKYNHKQRRNTASEIIMKNLDDIKECVNSGYSYKTIYLSLKEITSFNFAYTTFCALIKEILSEEDGNTHVKKNKFKKINSKTQSNNVNYNEIVFPKNNNLDQYNHDQKSNKIFSHEPDARKNAMKLIYGKDHDLNQNIQPETTDSSDDPSDPKL